MIKILDKNTIEKIAAGEVIERPSNAIKELIENSIDANSKNIIIEVINNGLELIRIKDDGNGFEKNDLELAFKRYATSKIEDIDDMLNINTFGFRGEALASISNISDMTIKSKRKNDNIGYSKNSYYGEEKEIEEIAKNDGTEIIIKNLFQNVPVRKKIFEHKNTEISNIIDIIEKESLANPNIGFKLIVNDKTRLDIRGTGNIKNNIYDIYGKDVYDNIIPIDDIYNNIKIYGYIGKPSIMRSNKNDMIYYVNNRYIKSKIIEKAIEEAYKTYLMQHKYPFVVLMLNIRNEYVDVNCHPRKIEVLFRDDNEIYDAVYENIKKTLENYDLMHVNNEEFLINRAEDNISKFDINENSEIKGNTYLYVDKKNSYENVLNDNGNCDAKYEYNIEYKNDNNIEKVDISKQLNASINLASFYEKKESFKDYIVNEISKEELVKEDIKRQEFLENNKFVKKNIRTDYHIVGQVLETYIIIEYNNEVYVVDQHAAHEKINFEKLKKELENNIEKSLSYENLVIPIMVSIPKTQQIILDNNIDLFHKLGYNIEYFGDNDYKILSIPLILSSLDKKEMFLELLQYIDDNCFKNIKNIDTIIMKIATMACKMSIKANNKLTFDEMKDLIDKIFELDNPYNCPHGRPTIVKITNDMFGKLFKRII